MEEGREAKQDRTMKSILLMISCTMLGIGVCGGPLISRLYFIHGGNRVWLSSFLQAAGFPIILLPLFISFVIRRRQITSSVDSSKVKMFNMKLPLFVFSAIIGIIIAFDSYLYSYGVARLSVSTFTLINATNLAFTAVFAFFLVKQKFTPYSINAVILLTMGAGILALHTNGDRPAGESSKTYAMGFVLTLVAAILVGLILPLVELAYKKGKQAITYSLVLEFQIVMCIFATLFCLVGMIANHDFKVIPREAKHFGLGETTYYVILVASAIIWQMNFLGAIGVIFCASSLFSGVLNSLFVPVTEILAVIFYKETFKAEKGVSLVLSIWGFVSYFYGEYKQGKKMKMNQVPTNAMPQDHSISNP